MSQMKQNHDKRRESFASFANSIRLHIIQDMVNKNDFIVRNMIYCAYNEYYKENDMTHYIFSLDNKDDMIYCIEHGLMTHEIAWLYNQSMDKGIPLFFFDTQDDGMPQPIKTWEEFDEILISKLKNIIFNVIVNPNKSDCHMEIYKKYVTDYYKDYITNIEE